MDKINAIIKERNLTLERTPAEESKKANLTDNTTSPATSSTARKEGAPSGQPAPNNAKLVAENPQEKLK